MVVRIGPPARKQTLYDETHVHEYSPGANTAVADPAHPPLFRATSLTPQLVSSSTRLTEQSVRVETPSMVTGLKCNQTRLVSCRIALQLT